MKAKKNHVIILIDGVKAFHKIQHPFVIKILSKVGIQGAYLNIIKTIHKQEIYSQHHTQWTKSSNFPLRSGTRQGYPLSPLLFNIVLEVLATAIRQERRHPHWKGGNKTVIVCRWHDSVYRKSYRLCQKTAQPNKWIWQKSGIQSQYSEIKGFFYTNNEISETEIRKKSHLI